MQQNFTHTEIYGYCLKKLQTTDVLLAIINKKEKSKGMLLELAEAKKYNKKIILIIKEKLEFNEFRQNAQYIIKYKNNQQLFKLLEDKDIIKNYEK